MVKCDQIEQVALDYPELAAALRRGFDGRGDGEAYREWRRKYGDDGWEAKFRQRFETEMIEKNDAHFFVGTIHKNPASWIIVGLFYPPKPERQATRDMFDPDEDVPL